MSEFTYSYNFSDTNLDTCVPGYPIMRRCALALQLAIWKHAKGTAAHGFTLAATHLYSEAIAGMPDEVVRTWGEYAQMSEDELRRLVDNPC